MKRTMVRVFLDACIVMDLAEGKPEPQDKLKPLIAGKQALGSAWTTVRRPLHCRSRRPSCKTALGEHRGYRGRSGRGCPGARSRAMVWLAL